MATFPKPLLPSSPSHPPDHPLPAPPSTPVLLTSAARWQSPAAGNASHDFVSPPDPSGSSFSTARCAVKGCIFPATVHSGSWCTYHERERSEPALFSSQQPSLLLLNRAQFGSADSDEAAFRARDRRRQAELWEEFLTDGLTEDSR